MSWAAAAIAALILLAGCGGGGGSSSTSPVPVRSTQVPGGTARPATGTGAGGVKLVSLGDFDQPDYVTQPPGDPADLFVVEQTGRIEVLHDGTRTARPFLDLSADVSCCGEQGLLSMAFAPDYARSGLLYVDYTDTAGNTRVVEYRRSAADPLVADP